MNEIEINSWAAGLFEGEGTFTFNRNKAKSISVTSTDLDVLERFVLYFKGSIYTIQSRKVHWKQAYIWSIRGKDAITFYNKINPYLLSRRKKRGETWITSLPKEKEDNKEVLSLFLEGKKHQEIAKIMGVDRSSISKYLNRRGLYRSEKSLKSKKNYPDSGIEG